MELPWYWRSVPLQERTGSQIFAQLFAQDRIATLLESPYPPPLDYPYLARYSICAGQPRRINHQLQVWTPAIGSIFSQLKQFLQHSNIHPSTPSHLPFQGGWLGWLGYDAAWEIETLPYQMADSLPFPVAYWYEPEDFAILDHQEQMLWLATTHRDRGDLLLERLQGFPEQSIAPLGAEEWNPALDSAAMMPEKNPPLVLETQQSQYEEMVRQAQDYIRKGDIFQANLSLRFHTQTTADSWQVYQRLQQINPSPFASYWRSPWGEVVSCSPERLVQLTGRKAQTRPIAGTRPRGLSPQEEAHLCQELRSNLKERAEHIMLVDLERNDLGRVCAWGTVQVDELLVIERYSHVIHLVSNVSGRLQPDRDGVDLLRALFPGGTITGCPKVRCLEIIEELEPVRRSLFYGSCGYLDQRGNLDLNILIRTLLFTDTQVMGQVGAGIVADSDPTQEWQESLQKAKAQWSALQGS